MDKPIKLAEFILSLLVFVGVLTTAWVSLNRENADQESRIKGLEIQFNKLENKSDKIIDKIETLTIFMARSEPDKK